MNPSLMSSSISSSSSQSPASSSSSTLLSYLSLPGTYQFANLENNCYMNAVHQVIFLIPEMRTRIQNICNRVSVTRVRTLSGKAIHDLGDLMNAPLYHPSKKQVETYVNSFFDWKTTISSFNYNLGDHVDVNEYYLDLIKILDAAALAVSFERDRDFETLFSFNEASYCSCNVCQSRSWKVCDPANA